MTTIEDPRQITYLTNVYDDNGMVQYQYQADGTSFYQFDWTLSPNFSSAPSQPVFVVTGDVAPYDVMAFRSCTSCTEGYPGFVAQISVTNPRGYTRQTVFNPDGYAVSDTNAVGMAEQQTTTSSYFPDNLVNGVTDQLGRVTNYIYDINANPTSVTQLAGTSSAVTTSMTYDSTLSDLLSITDPLNNVTSLQYDANGNAISVTDPLQHRTTFAYNLMGQVTSVTDAMQNTTQLKYEFGDLTGITDPMLNTSSMFHDGAGRIITSTDPLGHTVKYQYDNLDEPTLITDPLQGVTTLSYDPDGNVLTVQDARQQGTNNKTVYTYDNFDHLQTRTDPLLRQETYVIDPLGNLTSFTDRRGKVATLQYDGINRRTFAGYGAQAGSTYESTVSYTYDGGNRLTRVVDFTSGTITPVFDGLDRLTSETTPQGSVTYTYDNDSRLQTATVAGQPTVDYYFDNASRLYKVAQGGTTTLIGYDNANRRSTLTLPNGIVLTYGYDSDSRVNSMSYQLGSTSVGNLTYQYDADGRTTQVGGSLAGTTFPQAISSAAYDVANELTNWNGTTIGYDSNGNIVNDGVAAYTWNARNQLITRASTSFQYDSFGRRTLNAAGNNLLYEGADVGQEISAGTPVANRILGGTDEFFNRTDSTGTYSPISDALGSVLALTNSSGNIITQYGYDPYGNTVGYGGTSANVFQYSGRENDGNGLYFYRARYYSPATGRFISEDPLGFGGGDVNLYAYVGNNPINRIDPFGLDWLNNLADFSAGAGSVLTLGLTDLVNDATGASSVVNNCSGWHKAGRWTGISLFAAIGGAEGFEEGVERQVGEEWSHWIPDRKKITRGGWIPDFIVDSDLNGQYVSDLEHALNDDSRMLKGMTLADKNPVWLQQLNRIPPWVTDAAGAGAASGGLSSGLAGRNCGCK
jgi:RHS repeat-associated protein